MQAANAVAVDEEHGKQKAHRYSRVLAILQEEQRRMANAFRLARCPRSTVRDFVGIAELKTVDAKEHQLPHWLSETTGTGMSQTFATLSTNDDCHAEERRVLPLTFNPRLHEQECHPAQK